MGVPKEAIKVGRETRLLWARRSREITHLITFRYHVESPAFQAEITLPLGRLLAGQICPSGGELCFFDVVDHERRSGATQVLGVYNLGMRWDSGHQVPCQLPSLSQEAQG